MAEGRGPRTVCCYEGNISTTTPLKPLLQGWGARVLTLSSSLPHRIVGSLRSLCLLMEVDTDIDLSDLVEGPCRRGSWWLTP